MGRLSPNPHNTARLPVPTSYLNSPPVPSPPPHTCTPPASPASYLDSPSTPAHHGCQPLTCILS